MNIFFFPLSPVQQTSDLLLCFHIKVMRLSFKTFCLRHTPLSRQAALLLHLNFGFSVLSPATRRAGRPRVLTTSTQTPTTCCACCTSKGGSTSPPPRYGELSIKGPRSGISAAEPSQAWHGPARANNRTAPLPVEPMLLRLLS